MALYSFSSAPVFEVTFREAEFIKYVDNAYHALKVTFANEIGRIGKINNIDGKKIMEIFVSDKKLNISSAYFMPGLAYGGSCLPKDLNALCHFVGDEVCTPLLDSIQSSNVAQLRHGIDSFIDRFPTTMKVGVIGISFKPGTDDMRESPKLKFARELIDKGYNISLYDPLISEGYVIGSNKQYAENLLPNVCDLLVSDLSKLLKEVDVLVITNIRLLEGVIHSYEDLHIFDLEGYRETEFQSCKSYTSII